MVEIRPMTDADVGKVLVLLATTFSGDHFTEEWWAWKYTRNPHGSPILLVAEEEGTIVGLRAFWPRKFVIGDKVLYAHQAVDTAVHPNTRGKGIFTKLTQAGLEVLKQQLSCGVFNFPNYQSGPGYLKLGWRQIRRLRWWIRGFPNLGWLKASRVNSDALTVECTVNSETDFRLARDEDYVRWRYQRHPIYQYEFWDMGRIHGERLWAVTRVVSKKGFPLRVLIDVIGSFPGSLNHSQQVLDAIVQRVAIEPVKSLCILETSLGEVANSVMVRHGFIPIPRAGANYFFHPLTEDVQIVKFFERMKVCPGDMDTF